MRCAAKGHDARPYLVAGSLVEHRCLRCGALVGKPVPAAGVRMPEERPADAAPPPVVAPPPAEPIAAPEPPVAPTDAPANGTAPQAGNGVGPSAPALAALRELANLHAAGVLTDAEFAAKKAELLRRV
jgi:Short C-terminal domain